MSVQQLSSLDSLPNDSAVIVLVYNDFHLNCISAFARVATSVPQITFVACKGDNPRIALYEQLQLKTTYDVDISEAHLYDIVLRFAAGRTEKVPYFNV